MLEWHPAKAGDTFFIPAGTVHAIGGGMVLCEIQQYSDITYRLYDYGRPRELHLDHAVAVSKRAPHEARPKPGNGMLVSCPYFTTVRRRIKGRARLAPEVRFVVITHGKGTIAGESVHEGEVWQVQQGNSRMRVEGQLTILAVTTAPET